MYELCIFQYLPFYVLCDPPHMRLVIVFLSSDPFYPRCWEASTGMTVLKVNLICTFFKNTFFLNKLRKIILSHIFSVCL